MFKRSAQAGTRALNASVAALGIALAINGCAESSHSGESPDASQPGDGDGDGDSGLDNDVPAISVALRDGQIIVAIDASPPLYHKRNCGRERDQVVLEKRVDDRWVSWVDQRPRAWPSNGYTLDGSFVAADIGEGCAMPCERLDTELNVGRPLEYRVVNQNASPSSSSRCPTAASCESA